MLRTRVPDDPGLRARIMGFAKAAERNSDHSAQFARLIVRKMDQK